jgi:hypothetical protein
LAKVTAKFAVTVDLPTPPFPEATAIIFLLGGMKAKMYLLLGLEHLRVRPQAT